MGGQDRRRGVSGSGQKMVVKLSREHWLSPVIQATLGGQASMTRGRARRLRCMLHQQAPEFKPQPDPVLYTVIVLNVLKTQ